MRVIWRVMWACVCAFSLMACATTPDQPVHHATTHHWQGFAKTIPTVALPPDTVEGSVHAYYPIPKARASAAHATAKRDGDHVFMPPREDDHCRTR